MGPAVPGGSPTFVPIPGLLVAPNPAVAVFPPPKRVFVAAPPKPVVAAGAPNPVTGLGAVPNKPPLAPKDVFAVWVAPPKPVPPKPVLLGVAVADEPKRPVPVVAAAGVPKPVVAGLAPKELPPNPPVFVAPNPVAAGAPNMPVAGVVVFAAAPKPDVAPPKPVIEMLV